MYNYLKINIYIYIYKFIDHLLSLILNSLAPKRVVNDPVIINKPITEFEPLRTCRNHCLCCLEV